MIACSFSGPSPPRTHSGASKIIRLKMPAGVGLVDVAVVLQTVKVALSAQTYLVGQARQSGGV